MEQLGVRLLAMSGSSASRCHELESFLKPALAKIWSKAGFALCSATSWSGAFRCRKVQSFLKPALANIWSQEGVALCSAISWICAFTFDELKKLSETCLGKHLEQGRALRIGNVLELCI